MTLFGACDVRSVWMFVYRSSGVVDSMLTECDWIRWSRAEENDIVISSLFIIHWFDSVPRSRRRYFAISNIVKVTLCIHIIWSTNHSASFLLFSLTIFSSTNDELASHTHMCALITWFWLACNHQSIQAKLFSTKEIVAISCAWCKSSYHNKESCFNAARCTEPCSLGTYKLNMTTTKMMTIDIEKDGQKHGEGERERYQLLFNISIQLCALVVCSF